MRLYSNRRYLTAIILAAIAALVIPFGIPIHPVQATTFSTITPATTTVNQVTDFTATFTSITLGDRPITVNWDFTNDGITDASCSVGITVTRCSVAFTFTATGSAPVTATAVSSGAAIAGSPKTITVTVTPPAPIALTPSTVTGLQPGQLFDLNVLIGATGSQVNDLDGWEATITYDPSVLTAVGPTGASINGEVVVYDNGPTPGSCDAPGDTIISPTPASCSSGTTLSVDPSLKFFDTGGTAGTWDPGEPVVWDRNGNDVYDAPAGQSPDPIIGCGGTCNHVMANGDHLTSDPLISFVDDSPSNGIWDVGYRATAPFTPYSVVRGPTLDDATGTVIAGATFTSFPPVGPSGIGTLIILTFKVDEVPVVKDITFTPSVPTAGKPTSLTAQTFSGAGDFLTQFVDVKLRSVANGVSNVDPVGTVTGSTFTANYAANPLTVAWNFGDSTTGAGNPVNHMFPTKGTFNVAATAMDAQSRVSAPFSKMITISAQPLTVNFAPTTGNVGSVTFTATVTGGTSPYTFAWKSSDGGTGTVNPFVHTFASPNTYQVNVTVTDSNQQTAFIQHSVVISQQVTVTVTVGCGTGQVAGTSFTCTATPSGGTGPYSFTWTLPSGCTGSSTTSTISVTCSPKGMYSISVVAKDSNNVSSAPGSTNVNVAGQPVTVTNPSCGAATVGTAFTCTTTAGGGTPGYTFTWTLSTGCTGTSTTSSISVTCSSKGTKAISVVAKDANNVNSASASTNVNVAGTPVVTTAPNCGTGQVAGTAFTCTTAPSGGTPGYTFTWTLATGCSGTSTTASISVTCSSKGTKAISVVAKDSNNVSSSSASTNVNVAGQPVVTTAPNCGSGQVAGTPFSCTTTASGGTPGYTFTWTLPTGCTGTSTTSTISVTCSPASTYTISVVAKDSNNVSSASASTNVTVAPPAVVNVSVDCGTGQVAGNPFTCTATPSGGTPGYTFTWTLPSGCTGSSTTSTISVTCSPKGMYSISVVAKDSNNVSSNPASTNVNVAGQPVVTTVPSCGTGQVAGTPFTCSTTASGGTPGYTFTWTLPAGCTGTSTTSSISVTCSSKGTKAISVVAKDTNNVNSPSASTNVNVAGQPVTNNVNCGTGQVAGTPFTCTATPGGGTPGYTFTWTLPAGCTGTSTTSTISVTCSPAGTYTISSVAKDSNNVSSPSASTNVTVASPAVVTVSVDCGTGQVAGTAFTCTATPAGGTPGYTFTWTLPSGCTGSSTTNTISVTCSPKGSYAISVVAKDSNNVSSNPASTNVNVAAGQPVVTTTPTCGTGQVAGTPFTCNTTASGGTPGYTFTWTLPSGCTGTSTTSSISVTCASKGTKAISVVAKDSNNVSSQSASTNVNVAGQPVTNSVNCGTGQVAGIPFTCTATAGGGTPGYTFTWTLPAGCSGTSTTSTISVTCSPAGTYSISSVAKDSNNVNSPSASANVTVAPPAVVTVSVDCGTGQVAGTAFTCTATPAGGTPGYTFTWTLPSGCTGSSTASTISVTCSPKGMYSISVVAKDSNNVSSNPASTNVNVAGRPVVTTAPSCGTGQVAGAPFTCTTAASGGTPGYTFTWTLPTGCTGSSTTSTVSVTCSPAGTYSISVVAKDSNNVSSAAVSTTVSVTSTGQARLLLTFDAFDADNYENGVGEFQVYLNGQLVVDLPAGINHFTGSGVYLPYNETWVSFGPFDITSLARNGMNNLTFTNPLTSHESRFRNVKVVQGDLVFLISTRTQFLSAGVTRTLRFSTIPLALTSFTVTPTTIFARQPARYNATFNGGTGPFTCTFTFPGSDDSTTKTVRTTKQSCSVMQNIRTAGTFTVMVTIKDQNSGTTVTGTLQVVIQPGPSFLGDRLTWADQLTEADPQSFQASITNPATVNILVRLDFTFFQPDFSLASFTSTSFALNAGETRTNLTFTYTPSAGMGTYCFVARLSFGIDLNSDGILQDSEVIGQRGSVFGCFDVSSDS